MLISQIPMFMASMFLFVAASFLLIICLLFMVECVAAIFPNPTLKNGWKNQSHPQSNSPQNWQDIRVAILVPAHNEEGGIGLTLTNLIPHLKSQDKLIVIADNCDDGTAEIAIANGATVIERHDPQHRGKGYALDFGLKYLQAEPPDLVVIIDADCTVHDRAIEQLSEYAIATARPVQATYLMTTANDSPSSKEFIAKLANIIRNFVRLRGLHNLGQSCLLNGTGMAFPWDIINTVNLANGNLVEDLKLGLDLSIAGYQPDFCEQAKVTADFPVQSQAVKSQKTRWVHGHLQTIKTYVPVLLKQAIQQKRWDLVVSTLDLCIPPLSLLAVLWLAIAMFSFLFILIGASWIPAMISTIAGLFFMTAIFTAWFRFASEELPLVQLLSIPVYIASKIPVYLSFLIKPQQNWIRTQRD